MTIDSTNIVWGWPEQNPFQSVFLFDTFNWPTFRVWTRPYDYEIDGC